MPHNTCVPLSDVPAGLRGFAFALMLVFAPIMARADAPAPTQALETDPEPPGRVLGLSADVAAMLLGDFALRVDATVVPALSLGAVLGMSRRYGSDDLLVEAVTTAWFLGRALEGPHVSAVVGLAWSGPWSQRDVLAARAGGELGWQFLWDVVSITVGGGAHAVFRDGGVAVEPRLRAALGLAF